MSTCISYWIAVLNIKIWCNCWVCLLWCFFVSLFVVVVVFFISLFVCFVVLSLFGFGYGHYRKQSLTIPDILTFPTDNEKEIHIKLH